MVSYSENALIMFVKNPTSFVDWYIWFENCTQGNAYYCFTILSLYLWLVMIWMYMKQLRKLTWNNIKTSQRRILRALILRKKMYSLAEFLVECKFFSLWAIHIRTTSSIYDGGHQRNILMFLKITSVSIPLDRIWKDFYHLNKIEVLYRKKFLKNFAESLQLAEIYRFISKKNVSQLSRAEVGKLAAKIGQLDVVDNRELFWIFFQLHGFNMQ